MFEDKAKAHADMSAMPQSKECQAEILFTCGLLQSCRAGILAMCIGIYAVEVNCCIENRDC